MAGLTGPNAPALAAAFGTVVISVLPRSSCSRSTPPKKNSLFFRIGPPPAAPNWLRLNGGGSSPRRRSCARPSCCCGRTRSADPWTLVRAGLGDEADDAAHRAAVVGRIRVGHDAELLNRLDAERRLRRRDRRRTRVAAHVGAVEQIAVRPEAHAVDIQLGASVRRGRAVFFVEARDAGLQQRQVDVVAAVQRQLLDRLFGDDRRQRGCCACRRARTRRRR